MLRMAGIVSQPRPLNALQKQRGFASLTVALLNKGLLLFIEEPKQGIFLLRLLCCWVVGFFYFTLNWLYLLCFSFLSLQPGFVGPGAHLPDLKYR